MSHQFTPPSWEEFKEYLDDIQKKDPITLQPGEETDEERVKRLLEMFPEKRIKRIMKKEARKYKAALEKKWKHWLLAVSK